MPISEFKCDFDVGCVGAERPQIQYRARFCELHYNEVIEGSLEHAQCILGGWGMGQAPLIAHHWQTVWAAARRTD